jgi:hypothetical protein
VTNKNTRKKAPGLELLPQVNSGKKEIFLSQPKRLLYNKMACKKKITIFKKPFNARLYREINYRSF